MTNYKYSKWDYSDWNGKKHKQMPLKNIKAMLKEKNKTNKSPPTPLLNEYIEKAIDSNDTNKSQVIPLINQN
jgi:hypothetical protein